VPKKKKEIILNSKATLEAEMGEQQFKASLSK
jgi:hypothetical protein